MTNFKLTTYQRDQQFQQQLDSKKPSWDCLDVFFPVDDKVLDIITGTVPNYYTAVISKDLTIWEMEHKWMITAIDKVRENCSKQQLDDIIYRLNHCVPQYVIDIVKEETDQFVNQPSDTLSLNIVNTRIRKRLDVYFGEECIKNHGPLKTYQSVLNHVLGIKPIMPFVAVVHNKYFKD